MITKQQAQENVQIKIKNQEAQKQKASLEKNALLIKEIENFIVTASKDGVTKVSFEKIETPIPQVVLDEVRANGFDISVKLIKVANFWVNKINYYQYTVTW